MLLVGHIGVVEVPLTVGQLSYWQSGISIAEASHKQADAVVGLSGCRGYVYFIIIIYCRDLGDTSLATVSYRGTLQLL